MALLQWHGCTFLLFRSKFLLDSLCLHSGNMLKKLDTPALSSLAYLSIYNFYDRAVYFHINKAHPFKLGLNVIQRQVEQNHPRHLWKEKSAIAATASSLLLSFLIHLCLFFCHTDTKPDYITTSNKVSVT